MLFLWSYLTQDKCGSLLFCIPIWTTSAIISVWKPRTEIQSLNHSWRSGIVSGESVSSHPARREKGDYKQQKTCSPKDRRHRQWHPLPLQLHSLCRGKYFAYFLDSMGQPDIKPTQLLQLPQMWKNLNLKNSSGKESCENLQNTRIAVKHSSLFLISVHSSSHTAKHP